MILKNIALVEYSPQAIALAVVFFVGAFAYFIIKERINTKKGEKGEDLAKVREVIKRLLPDCGTYTTAYADHKDKVYRGRSTTTTYYKYAVAFKPGALFLVPIKSSGGEISYQSNGALFTPQDLGKEEADKYGGTVLFGLDGKEICRFDVSPGYTKQDKYEPLNIQQKPEWEAYKTFIQEFAAQVNNK